MIATLNMKHPLSSGAKGDRSKDAPPENGVNTVGQTSPLKTPSPLFPKASEVGGAASGAGPTTTPLLKRSKSRLLEDRLEYLAPYISKFARLINKNDLEDFDSNSLGKLVGYAIQCFPPGSMATYYKMKIGRYARKMKNDIQSAKNRADAAEKKVGDLNLENLKLMEHASLVQVITL